MTDSTGEILQAIGVLQGKVEIGHEALNKRMDDINASISKMEKNADSRMAKIENRVGALEEKSATHSIAIARTTLLSGGAASAITLLAVELLKRVH